MILSSQTAMEHLSLPPICLVLALAAPAIGAETLTGIEGRPREEVLDLEWEPMRQAQGIFPFHPEIAEVAEGSFRRKGPPGIVGSGYVVKTLEAALWAFHDAEDFREAVLQAVNLGDDADTTGAVCGQFAGAYWGESGIPEEWLEGLARKDMIEKALGGLLGHQKYD